MTYLISIIIPIYNGEQYIEKGLKSIIHQTIGFENLEVILVNDKSTDSTLNIIKKYIKKYSNIKLINLDKNHGHPGKPRNIGIKSATANYIMFMDQDDFHEPRSCEILYNKILKENVDIVSGRWFKYLKNEKIPANSLQNELNISNIDENPEILGAPSFVWVKIFKTSFIKENNIYFPENGIEDVVFTSHAFLKAKGIIFLKDDYVYTHYINPLSISRSKNKKYLNQLLIGYYNAYNLFKKLNFLDFYKYMISMRLSYFLNTLIRSELLNDEKIEILNEFKEFYNVIKYLKPKEEERIKLLLHLLEVNDYKSVFILLKQWKKDVEKNDILIKKKNKLIKENKILKNKLNEIAPIEGYIKYKIKNIKERI